MRKEDYILGESGTKYELNDQDHEIIEELIESNFAENATEVLRKGIKILYTLKIKAPNADEIIAMSDNKKIRIPIK